MERLLELFKSSFPNGKKEKGYRLISAIMRFSDLTKARIFIKRAEMFLKRKKERHSFLKRKDPRYMEAQEQDRT